MNARRVAAWTIRILGVCIVADLIADRRGFTLLDPFFFIPFACMSAAIAGPLIAATPGSMVRPVLQSCAVPAIILVLSLTLLNLAAPHGIWVIPGWLLVLEAAVLSLTSATAAAALTRALIVRVRPRVVVWGFRAAALAAILAYDRWPRVS